MFDALSDIDSPVANDRVLYLFASLPESYSMLVTALESNMDVLSEVLVTIRLA